MQLEPLGEFRRCYLKNDRLPNPGPLGLVFIEFSDVVT